MREIINKIHFQELADQLPEDVCKRALCTYNEKDLYYTIFAWGDHYSIFPRENKIIRVSINLPEPHEFFTLFIIQYLLRSKEIALSNEWISEKDIPGGEAFFRGPHEIPCRVISDRYGNDLSLFRKQCENLNGINLDMADAAYSFSITSRIPVAVLYWKGDDEFPPEAKILYDKTISDHLTCDIVFALAVEICTRIGSAV
jgi:hypothetical protein